MDNQTREERYDKGGATPGIEPGRDRPVCCGRLMYLAFTDLDSYYCGICGKRVLKFYDA